MAYTILRGYDSPNDTIIVDNIYTDGSYLDDFNTTLEEEPYAEFYSKAKFITGLVFFPIICSFGCVGNIMSLIVLGQKKMQNSTNTFLSALSFSDLIKLLNDLLYSMVLVIERHDPELGQRLLTQMYPYAHYILNMSVCVTAWLTVSVSVERYIAVCHPTKAKEMCTVPRARIVSIFVFIFMSLLALPSGLRYQTGVKLSNETQKLVYTVELTELGKDFLFKTAYTWIQNLLRSVIPLIVLCILNACIIYALFQSRVKGKAMSSRNKITVMLVVVVFVFMVCITPDAVLSTFFGWGYYDEDNLVRGVREISDLLLQINSAVNFALYCLFSTVFREVFIDIFCGCCPESCKKTQQERQHLIRGSTRHGGDGEGRFRETRDQTSTRDSPSHRQEATELTQLKVSVNNGNQTYV